MEQEIIIAGQDKKQRRKRRTKKEMEEYRANKKKIKATEKQSSFRKEVAKIFKEGKAKNPKMEPKKILPKASKIASYKTNTNSKVSESEARKLMKELGI